jgi:hypothetical protein
MLIAIVNGQTVEQVGDYQSLFPNTSFLSSGPTPDWLAENSCLPVSVWLPYDPTTQYLESVAPYIQGEYVYTIQVAQLTPKMIEQMHQSQAAQIGSQAASLLSATDWTTIPSVADPAQSDPYLTNQAEFIAWRSQVRAIAVTPKYDSIIPPQPKDQWSNKPAPTPTGMFTVNVGTAGDTISF